MWIARPGLVLTAHLTLLGQHLIEFPEQVLNMIEQQRQLPKAIYVCRPEQKSCSSRSPQRLQIHLRTTRVLPLLEEARQALHGHLGQM